MEENNLNNETPVEAPIVAESVVEAPMPEANAEPAVSEPVAQEPTAWEKFKISAAEEPADNNSITTQDLARGSGTAQAVGSVANGVIGVTQVENKPKEAVAAVKQESKKTVAIHSTKNVSWSGVGKVYRGYNIVTP